MKKEMHVRNNHLNGTKDFKHRPKIVIICGPTAIGKTGLSIRLAETFGGEIVSADSMQVYKYMDIGTAKPEAEQLARVRHHMIDIVDPSESYDAARYAADAKNAIASIQDRGKTVFVVGGTGLYIKVLIHGVFEAGASDPNLRKELKNKAKSLGTERLWQRLLSIDPGSAARIHPNDTYRIIRALEIYELTGRPMTELMQAHGFSNKEFDALKICLSIDRDVLYERIDTRVEIMLELGLIDEVKRLLYMGYTRDLKPMQSLGYRHMLDFIDGRMSLDEAVCAMKQDTRRYAKRQLTWFRKDNEMLWISPDRFDDICRRIDNFLESSS